MATIRKHPSVPLKQPEEPTIPEPGTPASQEDPTEEQAVQRMASLKELSILLYYYATKVQQQIHSNDNQPIIRKLGHKKVA